MTFFDSIKTVFRKYAEFEGRASRSEFWWFALFSTLVSAALGSIFVPAVGGGGFQDGVYTMPMIGGYPNLAGVWGIAVLLPSLAVTVRRLRDAGHNWAEIFWILLPIAGAIVLIVRLADPSVPAIAAAPAAPTAPPAPAKTTSPAAPAKTTAAPTAKAPAKRPAKKPEA
jgi:uncharacterized membrane protein YhaH (DUF805 family)